MVTIDVDFGRLIPILIGQAPLHSVLAVPPNPEVLLGRSVLGAVAVQRRAEPAQRVVQPRVVGAHGVKVAPLEVALQYFGALGCLVYHERQIVWMHLPCVDVRARREES